MKRLAIVGTGIAGLGCLYFLQEHYQITLYEQNDYIGGHTNTVEVDEQGQKIPIDTGFMVFNHITYPNLTRFFETLDIPTQKTDMSFSVRHDGQNLEWNGAGLNKLFGQRKNLFNPRFWCMLGQMDRFNREAVENLGNPRCKTQTVAEFVAEGGYGKDFLELYMVPMSSAIWSTAPHKMLQFPVQTLIRFFHNHGFLGLHTHHQWYTVSGGAINYVRKLLAQTKPEMLLNHRVEQVKSLESGKVEVTAIASNAQPSTREFDAVILAGHADQSLATLAEPSEMQKRLLSAFHYESNTAFLHTDTSVMPRTRRCWAAWNYHIQPARSLNETPVYEAATHYWMNRLQGVSKRKDYLVTINGEDRIRPETILKTIRYHHPIFDQGAVQAQESLPQLNQEGKRSGIYFCGSYFRYGFHEDAFSSALSLCEQLLGEVVWKR